MLKIEVNGNEVKLQMGKGDSEFTRWSEASNAITAIINENCEDAEERKNFCSFLKDTVEMKLDPSKGNEILRRTLSEIDTSRPMGAFIKAVGEAVLEMGKKREGKSEESENEK